MDKEKFSIEYNSIEDYIKARTVVEKGSADGKSHSKTARFVIGTSEAGWTEKDCDYLCDGVNDQEEIIQALQALNNLPATGGEIVILDGTYNITESIHIPKNNVSIRGNGNATILKRMYNSTETDIETTVRGLITLIGRSGCKIQDLQIDGDKTTYDSIYNYGIFLYSSSNNTITGNTFSNNSYGIFLYSSSYNTITGNTCNNNADSGIYLDSSSNNNTVTGNACTNNSYGIYLYSSSDNTVTGNACTNNSYGILLHSSSNNNTITGNTCNNNNSDGIYLYSSSNNTITGNTCIRGEGTSEDYNTDQYTIRLQGTSNYNLISSNNCMGKEVVVEGGTGNTLVNNKFDES